jgi:hypothetical protein
VSSPQDLPTLGTAVGGGGGGHAVAGGDGGAGGRSECMRAERVVAHQTDYSSLDDAVMIHTSSSEARTIPSYGFERQNLHDNFNLNFEEVIYS